MRALRTVAAGWRGICLVAITYVYFLIFAQFAFLHRLANLHIADTHLKLVMAAMATGGILFSFIAARLEGATPRFTPQTRIRAALTLCASAALLTLLPLSLIGSVAVAFLIGNGLGLLTVTLVTHLQTWLGMREPLLQAGLGTGLGYLACNFPPFFAASPQTHAIIAAALCLIGIFAAGAKQTPEHTAQLGAPIKSATAALPFLSVLLCFTALVWLDSAAFFIIQSTPALKAGTWEGTAHLWINGLLHLAAALASAWLLKRRGLPFVVTAAFVALAAACLLLLDPGRAPLASVFYPVGVSLYSVALVAYPALLYGPATMSQRARRAGWIYAVAGWIGSAMGIGMGQNLGHVPIAFVAVTGAVIVAPQYQQLIRPHMREVASTGAVLVVALCIYIALRTYGPAPGDLTAIERGRQVYISEGCINCHSQYVRPNSPDVLMWGPAQSIEELREQHPPLIGNRRQGPDLSQVGGRRSPLWLRAHFDDPQQVSHGSFMPSYKNLFQGSNRGSDLIAYLSSLKSPAYAQHIAVEQSWQPSARSVEDANATEGARLFREYCSTCHEREGQTRNEWRSSFKRLPPTPQDGVWMHDHAWETAPQQRLVLARIIKFGLPGTDMPGHEYFSDQDVSDIALWLNKNIAHPYRLASSHTNTGENQ